MPAWRIRRPIISLIYASVLFYLGVLSCAAEGKSIVVRWNEVALNAVRTSPQLGPPAAARALAIFHTCIYDAWAAYDDAATGTEFGSALRRPKKERTNANKELAISYAAYRAGRDLFPESPGFFQFMRQLGYQLSQDSVDIRKPEGLANVACNAVLATRHSDGSNQLGTMDAKGIPYSDYTGYSPSNPISRVPVDPDLIVDPDRFQPLFYSSAVFRNRFPEPFLGAQWTNVIPFAGPYTKEILEMMSAFPLARYGNSAYIDQARELIEISAALSDEQKTISEYWTDGPNSELPAGHWCLFAQFVSARDSHTLDDDTKLFFVLSNAVFDAGIAAWEAKRQFDSVRPVTAIPYLFRGHMIRSWGGPGKGTVLMDGSTWIPYQPSYFPSPPFPEYPSGHSTFSAAAAQILRLWAGNDNFGYSTTISHGSSKIERETPKTDITLTWPTFSSAADQAGISRRYGGLHFKSGDMAGRLLGKLVADSVWKKAVTLFTGSRS